MGFTLKNRPFFVAAVMALTLCLPWIAAQAGTQNGALQIVWWNKGGGSHDVCSGTLDQKLKEIASSNNIHILALGETTSGSICPKTLELLKKEFPNNFSIPYNPDCANNSIEVFSKIPLKLAHSELLDWTPINNPNPEMWRNKWLNKFPYQSPLCQKRPFAMFSGEFGGQAFNFVPIHLTDPWKPLLDAKGKVKTGLEIFFGHNNPNYYQAEHLKNKLNRLDSKTPLIVIGDFNFPPSFLGYHSPGYSLMTGGLIMDLKPLFPENGKASYPAIATKESLPSILIDQAYGSFSFQSFDFKVLHWAGSDHYPIKLSVSLEKPINSIEELIERLDQSAK